MTIAALDWRLRVWPPTGAGTPRIITRDGPPGTGSHIRSFSGKGLRLNLTPEGECRSAVWDAKGAGILLPPLSAVQVEYLHNGVFVPLWFGEVREGGNVRDVDGEAYNLRGLSLRFEEISLPPGFSTPEQAAHLTVRAIAQAVINSGDLGTPSLVQYVEALCPDLGFNCRKIEDGAEQDPASLLKQIAEDGLRYGVQVRWGVDPQRRFFCRAAKTNTRNVTAEAHKTLWKSPVAVTPCTSVLWYIGKYPNGRPLTYRSTLPSAATYGKREKRLTVGKDVKTRVKQADSAAYALTPAPVPHDGLPDSTNVAVLYDDLTPTQAQTERAFIDQGYMEPPGTYTVTLTANAPAQWLLYATTGFCNRADLILIRGGVETVLASDIAGQGNGPGAYQFFSASGSLMHEFLAGDQVQLRLIGGQYHFISEFRLDAINKGELDGLAKFHERTPSQQPADIETHVFVPPTDLPGRVRVENPPTGGPYEEPLEAVEYRLTSNGLQLGYLAGQADDPAALAQASLIQKRDGQAVITAITAQT